MEKKDDIENTIRKVLKEELQNATPKSSSRCNSSDNIYSMTQSLIRSTANKYSSNVFQPAKRSHSGHPLRYAPQKKCKGNVRGKMLSIILLRYIDEFDTKEDSIQGTEEVLNGYMEIRPGDTESDIKKGLTKIFKIKFPLIGASDFIFVKRTKNVLSTPSVCEDFEWNFEAVRTLAGQGKLYCRLQTDPKILLYDNDDEDLPTGWSRASKNNTICIEDDDNTGIHTFFINFSSGWDCFIFLCLEPSLIAVQ